MANGHPLAYLDNASFCQKSQAVIDAITKCYSEYMQMQIKVSIHSHSTRTGQRTSMFINTKSVDEIIFTQGTTEAIH
ncbi:aminotransferase class V-fold PLP-dependent enzyme [Yersinia frederiksenii]|uniref:aminotransferase class V-fold PLP-dependent enzyme n=1 Tax=Yersinia frederiksenii TaxID=29484 RepID=UPI0011A9D81C|nr:aminotransferase class V-fold PLP-dependent enzyme [Yersinia frederiksenii]